MNPHALTSLLAKASSSVKGKAVWGLALMLGACAGVSQGRAEDSAASVEPARDPFGDPLPAGAVARLGTLRLRHADYLHVLGFTPDGKMLVSMGDDGVRVWESSTGKPVRHFGAGVLPSSIALSADGRRVAFSRYNAGIGGPVEIWDVATGKLLHKRGNRHYQRVCFSPDGQRVAAFDPRIEFLDPSHPRNIDIWNAATGQQVGAWKDAKDGVFDMKFSADGKTLLLGGGKVISVRDAATGKEVRRLGGLPADVHTLVPSPRGDLIAYIELYLNKQPGIVGLAPGTRVFLLDARTGAERRRWTVKPVLGSDGFPENGWWSLAFSPDGRRLAACQMEGAVRVWDTATGAEKCLVSDGRRHSGGVTFSPDGKSLAVSDSGRTVRLFDADNGSERVALKGHRGGVTALAVAADGRTIFTATDEGMIHRWDARTGRELRQYPGHKGRAVSLALSPDGRKLCSIGYDGILSAWDVDSGDPRRLFQYANPNSVQLALSVDGQTLAAVTNYLELRLYNLIRGEQLHMMTTKTPIAQVAISADGSRVIALTGGRVVCRWQTANGRRLPDEILRGDAELPTGDPASGSADEIWMLSPHGRFAAHAYSNKFLRVLDVDVRRQVHRLTKLPGEVSTIAFAADERTLVWSEKSGVIHWLETATGSERRSLPGHAGAVAQMRFSADGKRLVSGSDDATALVWDLLLPGPATLSTEQCNACWSDLADNDAAKAYRAACRLIAAPADTLVLLRRHLKPVEGVDEKRIERLIADLDSDAFAVREKATGDLRKLGLLAEPACRKALTLRPTLEMRRRLQDLLDDVTNRRPSPDNLRQLRAVEVLERIGTPEARKLLESLAAGAAGARLTREARAAVQRLSGSHKKS